MRLAAEIHAPVGHRGGGPAGGAELGNLVSGKLGGLFCVEGEEAELTAVSSMPPGLAAALTPNQLADLLAYLQSLKTK